MQRRRSGEKKMRENRREGEAEIRIARRIAELEARIEYLCRDQENYEPHLVRRIGELEARLAAREEYISRRERQHDETANTVISLAFDKGKLEAENERLRDERDQARRDAAYESNENGRLREAIESAPHERECFTSSIEPSRTGRWECHCWKAKALEGK